jgi:hypothetical protein
MAQPKKNPAAVAMGKLGGRKGGLARMRSMTKAERSALGKLGGLAGSRARWKDRKPQKPKTG